MARIINIPIKVDVEGVNQGVNEFNRLNTTLRSAQDNIKNLNLKGLKSDLGGLKESVAGARVAFATLGTTLGVVTAGVAVVVGSFVLLAAHASELTEQFKELDIQLKTLQKTFGISRQSAVALYAQIEALKMGGLDLTDSLSKVNAISKNLNISLDATILLIQKFNDNLAPEQAKEAIEQLAEYGEHFDRLGFTAQEAGNIVANSIKAGGWADKVPDAIKEFGLALGQLSKEQKEISAEFGLDKYFKRIDEGLVSPAQGLVEITSELKRQSEAGRDVTKAVSSIFRAAGEDSEKVLLNLDQIVKKNIEINNLAQKKRDLDAAAIAANERILSNIESSKKAWDEVSISTKVLGLQLEGINTLFAKISNGLSFIGAKISQYFIEGLTIALGLAEGIYNVLASVVTLDFTNLEKKFFSGLFRAQVAVTNEQKKREAAEAELNKKRAVMLKCQASGGTWDELKKKCVQPQSGYGSTDKATIKEISALQEAEKRLETSYIKQKNIIDKAVANKEISTEQGNLKLAELEETHFKKVVDMANKLAGTKGKIDGEVVMFSKLKSDELHKIEVKTLENKHKTDKATIELEIATAKRQLEIATLNGNERLKVEQAIYAKEQKLLDMALERNEITWVKHLYETRDLSVSAIQAEISTVTELYNKTIETQKLTNEERVKLEIEFNNKINELKRRQTQEILDSEETLNSKRVEIDEKTHQLRMARMAKEVEMIKGEGGLIDAMNSYIDTQNKVQEIEVRMLERQRKIADVQAQIKDAQAKKDEKTVTSLSNYMGELLSQQSEDEEQQVAQTIQGIANMTKSVLNEVFSFISTMNQAQIDMLDKELERRKELLEVIRQQANAEISRLNVVMDIEKIRAEQRQKELDAYMKDLPEAHKQRIEQEKAEEQKRLEDIVNRNNFLINEERRRIKDAEQAVKVAENRKLALQQKQFETERAAKISNTLIDAIAGSISLWVNPGFPLAIALQAVVAAQTGIAIAKIAGEPNPYTKRYAKGTLNVTDGVEGVDSVPALLMPGEAVIPTKINKEYKDSVAAIYNKKIPASVLNNFVKNYNGYDKQANINIDLNAIVKAIEEKPVPIVNIDESGFQEYLVKTVEQSNKVKRKLGL